MLNGSFLNVSCRSEQEWALRGEDRNHGIGLGATRLYHAVCLARGGWTCRDLRRDLKRRQRTTGGPSILAEGMKIDAVSSEVWGTNLSDHIAGEVSTHELLFQKERRKLFYVRLDVMKEQRSVLGPLAMPRDDKRPALVVVLQIVLEGLGDILGCCVEGT